MFFMASVVYGPDEASALAPAAAGVAAAGAPAAAAFG